MLTNRLIRFECRDQVFCVRLSGSQLEDREIPEFADEMLSESEREGCRFAVLSLGPETPRCLFSVFLSRLVTIRNAFRKRGGDFVLCEVGPRTHSVFAACHLQKEFVFLPDFDAAVAFFAPRNGEDRPA